MKIGLIGGPGVINSPMMNYIMQSDSDADKIITTCEALLAAGYNPKVVIDFACRSCKINYDSLTDLDKKRVERRVEEVYNSQQTRRQ